jgi:hypothetical protein
MIGMLNQSNFPEQRVCEFGFFGQFLTLSTQTISGNYVNNWSTLLLQQGANQQTVEQITKSDR